MLVRLLKVMLGVQINSISSEAAPCTTEHRVFKIANSQSFR
jgi:hypothetical protein